MLDMDQYRRGQFVFDVIDDGPADGPVVVLLHGFPQQNASWGPIISLLTAAGYRCLAPNQRGYSPGARPLRRRDYRAEELVKDTLALIDASGAERVHLVGHDWGAAVAWGVAEHTPSGWPLWRRCRYPTHAPSCGRCSPAGKDWRPGTCT